MEYGAKVPFVMHRFSEKLFTNRLHSTSSSCVWVYHARTQCTLTCRVCISNLISFQLDLIWKRREKNTHKHEALAPFIMHTIYHFDHTYTFHVVKSNRVSCFCCHFVSYNIRFDFEFRLQGFINYLHSLISLNQVSSNENKRMERAQWTTINLIYMKF